MSKLIAPLEPAAQAFAPAEMLGNKFLNTAPTSMMAGSNAPRMIRRLLFERRRGDPKRPVGPFRTDTSVYAAPPLQGLRVTWMGHSTVLIEIDGFTILTDPVWGQRASFSSLIGPKRFYPPTLALRDLPPLDAVLLSHDHYDHLDRTTIEQLAVLLKHKRTRFVASLGLRKDLESWGIAPQRITELNWGQSTNLSSDGSITATPARHFSGRSLWNRNETLVVFVCDSRIQAQHFFRRGFWNVPGFSRYRRGLRAVRSLDAGDWRLRRGLAGYPYGSDPCGRSACWICEESCCCRSTGVYSIWRFIHGRIRLND